MPQLSFFHTIRQKARHLAFGSLLYNWSLGGSPPDGLTVPSADLWPGNAERGRDLCDSCAARDSDLPDTQDFDALRDLRAMGGNDARRLARDMIDNWIHRHGQWCPESWQPALTGRRVSNWIALYSFYGASADDGFQTRLFDSLARQSRHLSRVLPGTIEGLPMIHAVKGLTDAGLSFHGRESWLEQALDLLQIEIDQQILPDGGHISRSPTQLLQATQIFMDIRAGLAAAGYPVPEQLEHTIDRMTQALRFFRYPDKGFAVFNGAAEGNIPLIDAVLSRSEHQGRVLRHLPHTGYERATLGRSLLMFDAGAPPPRPYDGFAHAAPLAFEFVYGKERMLVSCGTHPTDPVWQDALKGTGAHNALSLDHRNACEIREDGHIGRRPQTVTVNRNESAGAILLEATHDGYVAVNGITHARRLTLAEQGHDLRGEDTLTCSTGLNKPVEVAIRFHLHPRVQASLIQDGREALLRLAGGAGWRFSHEGGTLEIEDSLYIGSGSQPRKTVQLVLHTTLESDASTIKWALQRETF